MIEDEFYNSGITPKLMEDVMKQFTEKDDKKIKKLKSTPVEVPTLDAELTMFFRGQKVAVCGGTGFLGKHVVELLQNMGAIVQCPSRSSYNLLSDEQTNCFFAGFKPKYVINLAGYNGNVQFNQTHSFDLSYNNLQMELNVLKNCHQWGVDKVCSIISACAYPDLEVETSEDMLWYGACSDSIKWHGHARRMFDTLSQGYKQQYGQDAITLTLTTMFGPEDSYHTERTKLMGGIIRRVFEAKQNESPEIVCWGTGEALRQVLYVKDAAKMVLEAFMKYNDSAETLNITNPTEYSVKELVEATAEVVGYEGDIKWDTSKPTGQARRWLSVRKMGLFIETPITDLHVALGETIEWYSKNKKRADERI